MIKETYKDYEIKIDGTYGVISHTKTGKVIWQGSVRTSGINNPKEVIQDILRIKKLV